MDAILSIPENNYKTVNHLQTIANTLNSESIEILAKFCSKNNAESSGLIKDLSTNFMTKKYF